MEINSITCQENPTRSCIGCVCDSLKSMFEKLKSKVMEIAKQTRKIGEDDPRRIVHAIKVGLALTFVSLFYYVRPLYNGFGQAGMWAILTVVVVFEFSVGGTLSKSINRGCATLIAGALGVGAECLAKLCGEKGQPFVLGVLVFLLAAIATFTRFFPKVKQRYDYGVTIFILTFSLVAVSGSQAANLQIAYQRLSTILIGGATCMIISIFVCPVWAGQDLHNLIAANVEKLATFLEGFGDELFSSLGDESSVVPCKDDKEKTYLQVYKSVLNSKATEESLANFAWWEVGHGRFKFHHPWKQYLKIGVLVRECACHIEVLNGCINSKPQAASEFQLKIHSTCKNMSMECSKVLKELSFAIKNMTFPSAAAKIHMQNSIATADEFKSILMENSSLSTKTDVQELMSVLVTASVLIDIIKCVEKISVSVDELSQKAGFRQPKSLEKQQQTLLHRGIVKPVNDHVVLEISETLEETVENKKLRSGIVKLVDDHISGGNDHIVIKINETLGDSERSRPIEV
ncbi:Aluminum-activated malate transporter 8 [Sesamum alatum]|uniref:Aluminum-activated malate transporter 8 n=1 Tax=Sesamum alatum TaxID=300844 RepID=A0AAE1XNU0_9LAMI|nr:Aluminum-activated malate transporter 8 [Sesamum alatum]